MPNEPNYKLLDADDKSVLGLPAAAIKLWLFYRLYSDELEESYYSVRSIAAIVGWDTKTVMKWQRFLLEQGRIVDTGERAANRYSKPTAGSHRVPVIRAEAPSAGNVPKLETPSKLENLSVGKIPTEGSVGEFPTKVLSSGFGYGSLTPSLSCSRRHSVSTSTLPGEIDAQKQEGTPNTKTNTNGSRAGRGRKPLLAKDGTPMPDELRDGPYNHKRIAWLEEHTGRTKEPVDDDDDWLRSGTEYEPPRRNQEEAKPKTRTPHTPQPKIAQSCDNALGPGSERCELAPARKRGDGRVLCDACWVASVRGEAAKGAP